MPYLPLLPGSWENQCLITAFVPTYRCGAVPDSHRVPFLDALEEAYRQLTSLLAWSGNFVKYKLSPWTTQSYEICLMRRTVQSQAAISLFSLDETGFPSAVKYAFL